MNGTDRGYLYTGKSRLVFSQVLTEAPNKVKPKLRGYFHQEAFYVTLGATLLLLVKSTTTITFLSALVYSFGLLLMFGTSALYHRVNWQPKPRALLKRLDHSAIFYIGMGWMAHHT